MNTTFCMQTKQFGNTELYPSIIGFGAWGIGGPSMAGDIPIGWGEVDDDVSVKALELAYERGIRFFDTADFYGLGHSEALIGKSISKYPDAIIATKVGHRLNEDASIALDYSKQHILDACEKSLKRLRRDFIDLYQLHSAKVQHLENGACIEALQQLKDEGKIRYWGISLSTYDPYPEAEFLMKRNLGNSFQVVMNVINQRALPLIRKAARQGYGIIARMPLQFGLLTGKITADRIFPENDHRSFRLPPLLLKEMLQALEDYWSIGKHYSISKTALSLSFCANIPEVSTVIPGIKTPEQAEENTSDITTLRNEDMEYLFTLGKEKFARLTELMQSYG
jgi:aryl-alcohol dehydrogenase-like predicted oxidoreductase